MLASSSSRSSGLQRLDNSEGNGYAAKMPMGKPLARDAKHEVAVDILNRTSSEDGGHFIAAVADDGDDDDDDGDDAGDEDGGDDAESWASPDSDSQFSRLSGTFWATSEAGVDSNSHAVSGLALEVFPDQSQTSIADRRNQARLLLVSLLENFCTLYSPQDNRLLFQVLCEKLSQLGIIELQDYNDSFSHVRGVYKRAFKELVFQALMATRAQHSRHGIPSSTGSFLIEFETSAQSDFTSVSAASDTRLAKGRFAPLFSHSKSVDDLEVEEEDSVRPVKSRPADAARVKAASPTSIVNLLDLHTTRYCTDFHEIKRLGKGGFGSVWHVRHKLDGLEYAVKRIPVADTKDFQRILREVKVLARMDHVNIVRYHSAWLEHDEVAIGSPEYPNSASHSEVSSATSLDSYSRPLSSPSHEVEHAMSSPTWSEDPASFRPLTLFIQMELCYSTLHDYLLHRNTLSMNPKEFIAENNFLFSSLLIATAYVHERGMSHRDITPRNLFLVHQSRGRPGSRDGPGQSAYRVAAGNNTQGGHADDVTQGPLCVWMKTESLDEVVVKLGDFGLVAEHQSSPNAAARRILSPARASAATDQSPPVLEKKRQFGSPPLSDDEESDCSAEMYHSRHKAVQVVHTAPVARISPLLRRATAQGATSTITGAIGPIRSPTLGVGTQTYAPPEQLQRRRGKFSWHPIKSDMFSLGVILLELFCPFTTGMERIMALQKLRGSSHQLPPEFIRNFPQYAAFVLWLTAEDPAQRPTPAELLKVFPPVSDADQSNLGQRGCGISWLSAGVQLVPPESDYGTSTQGSIRRPFGAASLDRKHGNAELGRCTCCADCQCPHTFLLEETQAQLMARDAEIARLRAELADLRLSQTKSSHDGAKSP